MHHHHTIKGPFEFIIYCDNDHPDDYEFTCTDAECEH